MKIAFVNITQGLVERGAETFVFELAKRLKKNHDVRIFSGNKLPGRRWPILWRLFLDPFGVSVFFFTLRILPQIWREKFDIIIPLNGGWQPAIVRIVTWLYGGRMVISGQSGKGWDDRNNLWCFPDYFVALSTNLSQWAKEVNPFIKIEYIPNGVDVKKFIPQGQALQVKLKTPIILCVGALTAEKRINLAIKAVAKMDNASLLVVGDGELREEINSLGTKLLGNRFLLLKMPFEEMPKVYRSADIFTLSSPWYRSFEIVLVEAMASGLPIVANDDPIRSEIVGNAGILVNPEDVDEYAQALKKALNAKWGNKPRVQAEKFDWDKISERYENLLKTLKK